MTHDTDIPQGYKATALGVIPQKWEVKFLGDLLSRCTNGLTYDVSITCGIPVTRIETISTGEINYAKVGYIPNESGYETFRMQKGDILYSHINSLSQIGKVAYYKGDKEIYHGMNLLLLRANNCLDKQYLYYTLLTEHMRHMAQIIAKPAVNQASISTSDLKRVKIAVPPLAEQRKIAEVLGVWDEAIEKQARLIEKLALRKRALMQRLLSAKLRLPGFSEPWEKVKLGDIGHFLSSNTLSRDCLNEQIGNIKNIHYGDILIKLPTIVDASFIHIPYVNDDVIVKSDYLKNGDIIFADTAEDYTVGKAIEIINIQAIPVTSGLHTIPFRPKSGIFVNRFLGYYVNSTDYRRQLQPLIQGIKVYSISKTALCKTTLKIPTLSEQTAIAEVLTAADREIELAKEKLERLRRQKRGLMQQLLTGKRRIKY